MTNRRLIAVDIGNSATKVGWFDSSGKHSAPNAWLDRTKEVAARWLHLAGERSARELPTPLATSKFSTGNPPPDALADSLPADSSEWRIVSVHREGTRILSNWIEANRGQDEVHVIDRQDLPVVLRVDFPERVGLDRLAAAVAANVLRATNTPAIVIGAGSAITVNLIAKDGAFEGGVILPGFRMSAEALYGADLLPLAVLEPNNEPPPLIGKNTEDAIRSGLFWGAVGAVREVVKRMSEPLSKEPNIFVTGGDLRQFTQYLGDQATFVPDLVLSGIAVAALCG